MSFDSERAFEAPSSTLSTHAGHTKVVRAFEALSKMVLPAIVGFLWAAEAPNIDGFPCTCSIPANPERALEALSSAPRVVPFKA